MIKITKFGGSSVADAEQFRKVKAIIDADPARQFVVVSASGRRFKRDSKVTDLLYLVDAHLSYHVSCDDLLDSIGERFYSIAAELKLNYPMGEKFQAFVREVKGGSCTQEYIVSRGEYFTAQLMAEYLGFTFVDAADVVAFHQDGELDMDRTAQQLKRVLAEKSVPGEKLRVVMPGFYGATRDGRIKLLDRGGGDISGSILAKCLSADVYENWTDVSGFYAVDPRIVPTAEVIRRITYTELRELSYMGASVLHEDAIFPIRDAGIPIVIKNTNRPEDPGTVISEVAEREGEPEPIITGVTGKRDFVGIRVVKNHMSTEVGFLRRVLTIFERYHVSIEHIPTGIDSCAVVCQKQDIKDVLNAIVADIKNELHPDNIEVIEDLALVATVGRNMASRPGISGHLFGALGAAHVNIRMIAQGSDEINIIAGVRADEFERAIKVIYQAFLNSDGHIDCV